MMEKPEVGFVKIDTTVLNQATLEIIIPNGVKVKAARADLQFIVQRIRVY